MSRIGTADPRVAIHSLGEALNALRDPDLTTMDLDEAKGHIDCAVSAMRDLRAVLVEQGRDRWPLEGEDDA